MTLVTASERATYPCERAAWTDSGDVIALFTGNPGWFVITATESCEPVLDYYPADDEAAALDAFRAAVAAHVGD